MNPNISQLASLNAQGGAQNVLQQGTQQLQHGMPPDLWKMLTAANALKMRKEGEQDLQAQMQPQPTVASQIDGQLDQAAQADVAKRVGPAVQQQEQARQQGIQQLMSQAGGSGKPQGGINQIPTQPMKMAEGGIIAFADGPDSEGAEDNGTIPSSDEAAMDPSQVAAVNPPPLTHGSFTDAIKEILGGVGSWRDKQQAVAELQAKKEALARRTDMTAGYGRHHAGTPATPEAIKARQMAELQGQLEAPGNAPEADRSMPRDTRASASTSSSQGIRSALPAPSQGSGFTAEVQKQLLAGMHAKAQTAREVEDEASARYGRNSNRAAQDAIHTQGIDDLRAAQAKVAAGQDDPRMAWLRSIASGPATLGNTDASRIGKAYSDKTALEQANLQRGVTDVKDINALRAAQVKAMQEGDTDKAKAIEHAISTSATNATAARSNALTNATTESTRLEAVEGRHQDMAMRLQEMRERARIAAQSSGDMKAQTLLNKAIADVARTATATAKQEADAFAKNPRNLTKTFDMGARQLELESEGLARHPVYQSVMKSLGMPVTPPAKKAEAGRIIDFGAIKN